MIFHNFRSYNNNEFKSAVLCFDKNEFLKPVIGKLHTVYRIDTDKEIVVYSV